MGLKVWLPLNGDLHNQGYSPFTVTSIEATPTFVAGKIGQCYQRTDSNAQVTKGLRLDDNLINTFGSQASVAVWVKPLGTHTHYNGTILSSGNWNAKKWAFGVSQDNTKVDVLCGSYNNYITCNVPVNVWTHLVSIYDNGTCTLYKNGIYIGQLVNQKAFETDADWTGICRETYASGYFGFNGCINDLRIYDHCLSAAEVREISQGLVLHYKLDDIYSMATINQLGNKSDHFSGWGSYGFGGHGQTTIANINPALSGEVGMVINKDSGNYDGEIAVGVAGYNLNKNESITFSAYVKGNGNTIGKTGYIWIYKSNGTNTISTGTSFILTSEWQRVKHTITWTYDNPGTTSTSCYVRCNRAQNESFYISNCQLESGTIATGFTNTSRETGAIQDSSGYNHNAVSNGSQPITIDSDTPKYNYSTKFISGSRIAMPVASSTCLPTQAITVSIWYKSSAGTARFLSCTEGGGWNFEVNSSKASFPFYINGKGYGRIISTRNFYSDNQWHMITVTYDGVSTGKWYWDGTLDNTITITSGWENLPIKYNANTPLTLGAEAQTIASPIAGAYVGNLSDLRIYCTALDADVIRQLYEVGAKIDNKQNLHTLELKETCENELFAVPLTTPFNNNTTIYSGYNNKGEIYLNGYSSVGTNYISINPTSKTYYYDIEVTKAAGNQFYFGLERYDANKTATSNSSTVYPVNNKADAWTHKRFRGTVNLSADSNGNTCAFIRLRILNYWSGSSSTNQECIIHELSLREVTTPQSQKISKQGHFITDQFIENTKASLYKNGTTDAAEFIEI